MIGGARDVRENVDVARARRGDQLGHRGIGARVESHVRAGEFTQYVDAQAGRLAAYNRRRWIRRCRQHADRQDRIVFFNGRPAAIARAGSACAPGAAANSIEQSSRRAKSRVTLDAKEILVMSAMAAVPVDARYRCGKSLNFRSAAFVPSRAPRPKSNGKDAPASIPPASGAARRATIRRAPSRRQRAPARSSAPDSPTHPSPASSRRKSARASIRRSTGRRRETRG